MNIGSKDGKAIEAQNAVGASTLSFSAGGHESAPAAAATAGASCTWEMLVTRAEAFAEDFAAHHHVFVTAESCTGGLISGTITAVSGSSQWFERAFITYTNEAKMQMLGVKASTIEQYGAVSLQTVRQMACGALERSSADISVAVSGIAGPTGGSALKPVGTVCIAFARRGEDGAYAYTHHFKGDRMAVRLSTVQAALEGLLSLSAGNLSALYEFAPA